MALHDGPVNWPLFFGCILIGFGPLAALFFFVVAKRAQLVILALSAAFVWLVAILVTATLWHLIPPLKTSLSATVPVGVVVQEAFRMLFFYLYTRTEKAVKRVTTSSHQLPLNDITSSLAGGVGFSAMHALLMFGSLVGSSTGSRGAAFSSSCESIPLIFSAALSTLALTALDVALMVVAFDGYRKRSVLIITVVFGIHMGVALSALANMDTNGCYISIPVHYAGAVLACAGAVMILWRSKRLAIDAK
ncbi:gammasecretase subunit aph [Plasmopara halstedii]|uniref:Gammasecretase subunit aph n=1 Tax=Plasmopara halstedii TaxID=4781 RepID=A0A0P1A6Q5_PLAHL|nr:gammasecretase subunit aph [Plasmopara halstedii]CEG36094.1 gammasecretase subunit aph [Plasmopara halstedii]|eukprot:XP_024572463.1 gammasecretase subunit aph [Plasmopara halstedii]